MPARRFPPPWSVEEQAPALSWSTVAARSLRMSISEEEPGRRSSAKLLTKDEARRIVVNMAKLPQLLLGF
jgi:hypothetical protein